MANEPELFEAVFGSAKGEPEPTAFELSDEVQAVAERLLGQHLLIAKLRQIRIAFLLQTGAEPQHGQGREGTIDTIAKAQKVNPLFEALSGYRAVIWANEKAWRVLGAKQREAVILHELLHLEYDDEKDRVVVLKHDVEEFGYVVAHYGPWHGGLERFGEQMNMWGAEADQRAAKG